MEFGSSGFLPHATCLVMRSDLIWLHVLSDALIAIAYFAIPLILVYFDVHRRGRHYSWVLVLFACFILLCGVTHVFGIWTMWVPDYYAEGFLKALTAIVSVATAVALLPEVPKLLALRNPDELEALNQQLAREASARSAAMSDLEHTVAKLQESNQNLERFAYVTSHDLKAPLRSISSFTSLLERRYGDKLDDEAGEFFEYIRTGVQQMQDLTDDLLQLYRVNTASGEFESVDMNAVAEQALKNLETVCREVDARVVVRDLPRVHGMHSQLLVVIRNLLANALKFRRPDVPPDIEISAESDEQGARFRVRDNGIGVPPDNATEIFETFRRLHTQDDYPGTGIGLALCAKVVERHGGRIWVEQHDGDGASFCFSLPRLPDAHVGQRS